MPVAKWSLGKLGLPINILACAYSWTVFFWSFWPSTSAVTPQSNNWASAMFIGVLVLATANYFLGARKRYTGPVALVTGF